jgi:hypothetical protein
MGTKDKEKCFKIFRKKDIFYAEEAACELWMSSEAMEERDNGVIFLKSRKQRTINPEFYIQQNYPSWIKGMKIFPTATLTEISGRRWQISEGNLQI